MFILVVLNLYKVRCKIDYPQLRFNATTLPNQDVLAWHLGAKFSRKVSRFIC